MLAQRVCHFLKQSFAKNLLFTSKYAAARTATKQKGPNIGQQFSEIITIVQKKQKPSTGRSWRTQQLRLKSNEDLHKLWFVCVKQKNILLADQVIESKFNETKVLHNRISKVTLTMNRILGVIRQRQHIKKQYRKKLEEEYISKKRQQLRQKVSKKQQELPEITWKMLRAKYISLRKGVDNTKYLQKIWQQKQVYQNRRVRMLQRLKNKPKNFTSFWDYELSIGQRPLQQQILRTHIRNWKSLNLKQRKIILGFLNAKRSKDAKNLFIKELRILGDKIAQDQVKERIQSQKSQ